MKLVIVHNHYRPGGVRRVIELATPWLVRGLRPPIREIVLAGGEPPPACWQRHFQAQVDPVPVHCRSEPAFGYLAEQTGRTTLLAKRIALFLESLLQSMEDGPVVIWAHNQGLGRNLLLTRELTRAAGREGVRLVFHHHDWWFDNRWQRWPEMRRHGTRTLHQAARIIFPPSPHVRHLAINHADAKVLARHFHARSAWVPNPGTKNSRPSRQALARTRHWLRREIRHDGPVWLMPCRLLRRKNIAEALLLTRWLRPEAWLVTTGGVTSREEQNYAERLREAARVHRWPLRLALLHQREARAPSLDELLGASEAILLTSLQEGFGLPYLEAAAAGVPLIARELPNIAPDLRQAGLRFPQSYREVWVDSTLFDWDRETHRQRRLFQQWRAGLPEPCRPQAGLPLLLAGGSQPRPVPFSRLTLTAQLEVLAHPPEASFAACAPFNPWLLSWRRWAASRTLRVSAWPARADRWFGAAAFVRRFSKVLGAGGSRLLNSSGGQRAQAEFIRQKLRSENLYPLTWRPQT